MSKPEPVFSDLIFKPLENIFLNPRFICCYNQTIFRGISAPASLKRVRIGDEKMGRQGDVLKILNWLRSEKNFQEGAGSIWGRGFYLYVLSLYVLSCCTCRLTSTSRLWQIVRR